MRLVDTLNLEQKESALSKHRNSLVVASAGTGKTSTIMGRIEYLLNSGVNPKEIALITFTSKAATEILDRLERYFKKETVSRIVSGTFHAIALKYIKKHDSSIDLIHGFEAEALLRSASVKCGLSSISEEERYSLSTIKKIFFLFEVSGENSVEDFIFNWISPDKRQEHPIDMYAQLFHTFNKMKTDRKKLEFNDLLIFAQKNSEKIGLCEIKHIIIDEYQDTNPIQERMIDSIPKETLFCVGDYDQSIYGFNGSDISIISSFLDKYDDSGVFNLKRNYRSAPAILQLAEKVISNNERIFHKELIAEYKGETGNERPDVLVFNSQYEQYENIAVKILSIPEQKRGDIAILYRGNSSGIGMEIALNEYNIDYIKQSKDSFFDRVDVKIMLSCLKLAQGEFLEEDLEGAYFDIDVDSNTVSELFKFISKNDFCVYDVKDAPFTSDDSKRFFLEEFFKMRKSCRNLKKPEPLLKKIFDSVFYQKMIENQAYKGEDTVASDEKRIGEKERILLDVSSKHKTIQRFLNSLFGGKNNQDEEVEDAVKLMTVHASKGLEFSTVFIVDLTNTLFPNQKLMVGADGINEERRLFYVAVTRAKNTLWLCYPKKSIKGKKNEPSLFLREAGFINLI